MMQPRRQSFEFCARRPVILRPHSAAAFEPLEDRRLLSAGGDHDPRAFATLLWNGREEHVRQGEWILQLDPRAARLPLDPVAVNEQINGVEALVATARADVHVRRYLGAPGTVLLRAPSDESFEHVLADLGNLPGFQKLEPNFRITADAIPDDTDFDNLWGMNNTGQLGGTTDVDIDAPESWDFFPGNRDVVVAVIDSGISYNHPDLTANIWTNPGETAGNGIDDDGNGYIDDVHGWDFINDDSNPIDDRGHGTHVAGTIGAIGNNDRGVTGVNWRTSMMALKILDENGDGTTAAAIAAANYAVMMRNRGVNIRVANNSYGGAPFSSAEFNAINAARTAGIIYACAAGNGGPDEIGDDNDSSPEYPASYSLDNIISVASINRSANRATSSNFGATSVDLGAPGVDIRSTWLGSGYADASGTSMATPHVAGTVALASAFAPAASWQTIRDAILKGVDATASLSGVTVTSGRLNAFNTLRLLGAAPGSLDANFNHTGTRTVEFPLPRFPMRANDVLVQPDGKILVAGTTDATDAGTGNDFMVARFLSDGTTLDPAFNGGTVRRIDFDVTDDQANAVALLPNGQILVAGTTFGGATSYNMGFILLNADGTFASIASYDFAGGDDIARDIALQSNGMAVIAGVADGGLDGSAKFGLLRLNPLTLALDSNFDLDGRVVFNIASSTEAVNSLAIQNDGKIIVAGSSYSGSNYNFAFARLTASGALDGTFGSGGARIIDFVGGDDACYATAIQPDGKILFAGYGTWPGRGRDFLIARFNANGSEDFPFGGGGSGFAMPFAGASDDLALDLALQPDGKIVLAGSTNALGPRAFGLIRFNSNGLPDSSFGPLGWGGQYVQFTGANDQFANAVALDGDGRIVVAGNAHTATDTIALARLSPGRYPKFGVPFASQTTIQAEDYDNGGEGVGYWDNTPDVNEAGDAFPYGTTNRPGTGMDIELNTANVAGASHLAHVRAGEFVNYTVSVSASRTYDLQFRVASPTTGGTFHLDVDGLDATGPISMPGTGSFLNFTTLTRNGAQGIFLTAGTHVLRVSFDTAGASSFVGNLDWLRFGDFTAPTSPSNSFVYNSGPPQRFTYQFSEDVSASLSLADFQVRNDTTGTNIAAGAMALSYNSGTNVATLTFPGFTDGVLPDGRYTATLFAAGVTDAVGNPLPANIVSNFSFLRGDADANGQVNLADFNILAANFGLSGRTYSQGDFDYNGLVNLADFNILAARFGTSVAPPQARNSSLAPSGAVQSTVDELRELLS